MRPSGYFQTSIVRSISCRFSDVSSSKYNTRSYCTASDFVTFRRSRRTKFRRSRRTKSRFSSARNSRCALKSLFCGFGKRAV